MKKREIVIGRIYKAKISGKIVPIIIKNNHPLGGWSGRNLKTRRTVRIRSAQKLRSEELLICLRHDPTVSFVIINGRRVGQGTKDQCRKLYDELMASHAKAQELVDLWREQGKSNEADSQGI